MLKVIKKIVFVVSFVIVVTVGGFVRAEGAGTMYLQPDSMSVNIGDQFSTIVMVDASGSLIKSATANFSYDNTKLEVLNVDIGSTFEADSGTNWNSSTITISMSNSVAKPSDGELGTIYFEAIASGTTNVPFLNSSELIDWEDDDILVIQPGGTISVNEPAEDPGEEESGSGEGSGNTGSGTETGSTESTPSTTNQDTETTTSQDSQLTTSSEQQSSNQLNGDSESSEIALTSSDNSDESDDNNYMPYVIGGAAMAAGALAATLFTRFRSLGKKKGNVKPLIPDAEEEIAKQNKTVSEPKSKKDTDLPFDKETVQNKNDEISSADKNIHKIIDNRSPEEIAKAKKDLAESRKKPGAGTLNAGPGSAPGETRDFPLDRQSG